MASFRPRFAHRSSVQNGTVTVDVPSISPFRKGARPDLSVDGTIEIENLKDVLYVGRPVARPVDQHCRTFKTG